MQKMEVLRFTLNFLENDNRAMHHNVLAAIRGFSESAKPSFRFAKSPQIHTNKTINHYAENLLQQLLSGVRKLKTKYVMKKEDLIPYNLEILKK